jgi:hypothetical protein
VALNWGWVCNVALRLLRPRSDAPSRLRRNLAGMLLVMLIAGLVGSLLWAAESVKVEADGGRGQMLNQSERDNAETQRLQGGGYRGGRAATPSVPDP